MNVLHLSPHFPPRFHFFSRRLAARGAQVLGITDQHPAWLPPEVRQPLADHRRVPSLHDHAAVVAAAASLRDAHGPLHRVESHLETWLELEAEVREALDLPGLPRARLATIKRKSRMKEAFQAAGVAVAAWAAAHDTAAVEALVAQVGFPLFAKPDSGVGSQGTRRLDGPEDLAALQGRPDAAGYLVEQFLEGEIVTFDGLAGADGRPLFYTSHRYSVDAARVVGQGLDFHFVNERHLPADLEAAGRAVVEGLDIAEKFFHLEFFRRPGGELAGIELNIRPPGGFATDVFNFAHDLDVYDLWAQVVLEGRRQLDYDRPYHCAHVSRRDRYRYRRSLAEVRAGLGEHLCMVERLNPLYATAMGEWALLVRHPELGAVEEMAAWIQETA